MTRNRTSSMVRNNTIPRDRRTGWAFGLALVMAAGGAAHADILYDALLADPSSNSYSSTGSVGGLNVLGFSLDMQSADDFVLSSAMGSAITNVTFDVGAFTNMGAGSLPSSAMVEFFADVGGAPAETATATSIIGSANFTSVTQFDPSGGLQSDDGSMPPGFRIGLDLSGEGIVLGAGTWWVSVVGISDDNAYSIMAQRRNLQQTGAFAHVRDGGLDHGNGFAGFFGSNDWIPSGSNVGDLALRIEGTVIPGPGGAALLGLAGLATAARRRR